jgi:subtilisin family serine protease
LALALVLLAVATAGAAPSQAQSGVSMPGWANAAAARSRAADPELDLLGAPAWLDPPLRHLGSSAFGLRGVQTSLSGEEVVSVILRGSVATSVLRAIGVNVQSEIGDLRTARVPLSALPALVRLPGVDRISLGYRLKPHLDVSVPETEANLKRAQSPPLWGWYGKNVIVGIVDTGFDYQHDDFRNPDGTTRFYSIWDQNVSGTPPPAFGYGNECTTAQINAGTCSEIDDVGHGSHVLGIAAGDGSATGNGEPQYTDVGMANGAQLIGVATTFFFADLVDGVNYIFQKAALLGKPAVVNLSLGTELGPHDGTMDFELGLDALTGPGKIVCSSAGNGEADQAHASQNISSGTQVFKFQVPTYTPNGGGDNDYAAIDLWHSASNSYSVRVRRPAGALVGPVVKGGSTSASTTDGQIIIDYTNTNDPNGNGQSEIYVEINDVLGTPPGIGTTWEVQLTTVAAPANPKVHAWMQSFLGPNGLQTSFNNPAIVDTTVIVSAPGTADSLITTAAYTSKYAWAAVDGNIYHFTGSVQPFQICPFSARGPRRDGVAKPDITAPGSAVLSVMSADANPPFDVSLVAPDAVHASLQGTSMASPHVTGAVAMLLQKYPTLTPSGAKALLASAARKEAYMGTLPNPRWGAGKLDLGALLCSDVAAPTVAPTYPLAGNNLYRGTQTGLNWTASDDAGVQSVSVEYRIAPAGAWTPIASGLANDGPCPWTVPNLVGQQVQIRYTAFDCTGGSTQAIGPAVSVLAPSVDVPGGDLPPRFAAYHPAPSPFSSTSTLRFDLPAAPEGQWPVDVSLYNIAGRRVRTLVHGELPPGRYGYPWDGRSDAGTSVSAGIYFVLISAGPNTARERIIYLR